LLLKANFCTPILKLALTSHEVDEQVSLLRG
jgi:hypothetical protein